MVCGPTHVIKIVYYVRIGSAERAKLCEQTSDDSITHNTLRSKPVQFYKYSYFCEATESRS
ncbi:hypothetical protein TOT_010001168 [Theileria orientalis strain Shintoku]|uniref:Uncharacterized protein n=1 Tax=Theileria orientalis strain Shintoku TaxID=869250 RepID=J4DNX4_THEOR|nr:hypothetical protein TOT_010001168 [Theileria orientalis strain Shintoku]BAM39714.1 hypothetical protein TOT_010001168 [Theileria orientalis strain Shintoku]|eukprot:XP_009690015.1 hypothetical protein TOT_010001168 [Theileria orientalis strain Shintoku]